MIGSWLHLSVSTDGQTDRQTHIRTPLYGSYRAMRRRYSRVVKKIGDSFTYACLDKSKMDSDIRCYVTARSGGIVAHGGWHSMHCTVPWTLRQLSADNAPHEMETRTDSAAAGDGG